MSKRPVTPEERREVYEMIDLAADTMGVDGAVYRNRMPEVYVGGDGMESPFVYDPENDELVVRNTLERTIYEAAEGFVRIAAGDTPETDRFCDMALDLFSGEPVSDGDIREQVSKVRKEWKGMETAAKEHASTMEELGKKAGRQGEIMGDIVLLASEGKLDRARKYLEKNREELDDDMYRTAVDYLKGMEVLRS